MSPFDDQAAHHRSQVYDTLSGPLTNKPGNIIFKKTGNYTWQFIMFSFCHMVRDHNSSPIQWKINLPKINSEKEFKHLEILDEEKHFKIRKREPEKPWVNKKTRKEEETTAERPPKTLLKFYSIVKKLCQLKKRVLKRKKLSSSIASAAAGWLPTYF